jgi:hypothetical protein
MKTNLDCMPCFLRQSLDACRIVSDDEDLHAMLLQDTLRSISGMDMRKSPPEMARIIHRMIRQTVGSDDPYRQIKDESNALALAMLPRLRDDLAAADDPLDLAVRFSIAANIIDCGVDIDRSPERIAAELEQAAQAPIAGSTGQLARLVDQAESILFLADNAGEIVIDRLLIEQLPAGRVTVAVRGLPIINDATYDDAITAGLDEVAPVIDNGTDIPGTVVDECSEAFRKIYQAADLVIAKGQGNYETLSHRSEPILFLLKTKCPVIAADLAMPIGSAVIRPNETLAGK